jgi:hypothetical protein
VSNPYQPPSSQDPSGQRPFPTYHQPEADPYGQQPDPYGPQPDPYGQQPDPYGQRGASGYPGAVARPYDGYAPPTGNHPQGTLILVLGIAGFLVAGIISPVAWVLGSRAMKDIRATGSHPANEQLIVVGRILGIVGTVLLILGVLLGVLLVVLTAVVAANLQ